MRKTIILSLIMVMALTSCDPVSDITGLSSETGYSGSSYGNSIDETNFISADDLSTTSEGSFVEPSYVSGTGSESSSIDSVASESSHATSTSSLGVSYSAISAVSTSSTGTSSPSSAVLSQGSSISSVSENNGSEVSAKLIDSQVKKYKITSEMIERSVVSEGNTARLAKVMKKARNKEKVTIAVFGGSITQGAAASSSSYSYAGQIKTWWEAAFPESELVFVNAGMGATGSLIGVHRINDDLFSKAPDLVIVEFAVNDDAVDPLCKETYENVIRRIMLSNKSPAVLLLFTFRQDGSNAQVSEIEVGSHYDLPMISYRDAVFPEIVAEKYRWSSLAADGVHPNNNGHAIIGTLVNIYLQSILEKLDSIPSGITTVPSYLKSNSFENASIRNNRNITATSLGGFTKTDSAFSQFPYGWIVNGSTSPIVFEIESKNLFLMYKMDVSGNGGRASIKVDGSIVATVDSNFQGGWGDYAKVVQLLREPGKSMHRVEIQLQEGTRMKFTILALLAS